MSLLVDQYLQLGCGRCPRGGTPACTVNKWRPLLMELRRILLETPLTEDRKWGVPCYTSDGKNVVLIGSFNDYVTISFLKGALLHDPEGILQKAGPNSYEARIIRFTNLESIINLEDSLHSFILEAAENERKGLRVEKPSTPQLIPGELQKLFDEDPGFEAAFHRLTPGRQRGYLLHFGQAKQSETRLRRIEKYIDRIFEGKGVNED